MRGGGVMIDLLLCTDLDRTLIPNGSQPESAGARQLFARLAGLADVRLAYVSGRHRALIEQAMRQYDLPRPDYVIADVGTTIYHLTRRQWRRQRQWEEEIAGDWQGMNGAELHVLLADMAPLRLQEWQKQGRFKLSYCVSLAHDSRSLLTEVAARLASRRIRTNLVWSIDEERRTGLLDILPAAANKRHAIDFLMRQCGLDAAHTLFAGDSGNDLDVLLSPIPAVLVANADAEVRRAVARVDGASLYLAHGGFLGMNGCYSAGIVEGVVHFRPEFVARLVEEPRCGH